MDEGTSKGTITRQALGRIASLGDLYDARTDTFCATNMFKLQLPPDSPSIVKTDIDSFATDIIVTSSFQEKLQKLDVSGELKMSLLCGMIDLGGLGGSGKYLKQEKTSFKSVESTLVHKITTVHESLALFNPDLKPNISVDALSHPSATHVVVQIHWGANFAVTATHQNSENNKKKEIEGELKGQLEKLKAIASVSGGVEGGNKEEEISNWSKFSIKIFGDVLPDSSSEFPDTVDGALSMMRNMQQLIEKCNDGKGKPLSLSLIHI